MAKLLKHPLDCVRLCPSCGALTEARYDGAQLLFDSEKEQMTEARLYTCLAKKPDGGVCEQTYSADVEPRPDVSEDRNLDITDLRAWERQRQAEMHGPALPPPAPPVSMRAVAPRSPGFYSILKGLAS